MIIELFLGIVNFNWDSDGYQEHWSGWGPGDWQQYFKFKEYNWITFGIDCHIEYEAYLDQLEILVNILGLGFCIRVSTPETEKSKLFKERLKKDIKSFPEPDKDDFNEWDKAGID